MRILIGSVILCATVVWGGCGGDNKGADAGDALDDTPDDSERDDGFEPEVECTINEDCDDFDPCSEDICIPEYGLCDHEPVDADADGYRAAKVNGIECGGMDCDDSREDVYPGADPVCDGEDHDCSGRPDNDEDTDGYLDDMLCPDTGDDCDDTNPDVHPGVPSDCQAIDVDCDGLVENDLDGDGHAAMACGGNDCDDGDDTVYWGAIEIVCDGKDNDCNGSMDGFEDADHDGYANEDCVAPGEEVDCADDNVAIHPGATEVCDMIDQDCDGTWADGGADDDGDGYLDEDCGGDDCDDTLNDVYWGAVELCNDGVDQDCDGIADGIISMLDDMRISNNTGWSPSPSLVWTGSEFGLVWQDFRNDPDPGIYPDNYEIYFVRISETGSRFGSDVRITNDGSFSAAPSMVWTGSEFGVSWLDDRDGNDEIYFARISSTGSKMGADTRITSSSGSSRFSSLVWTGSEFGVSWYDLRDGNYEIYFARISDSGRKVGTDVRITSDSSNSAYPSLAWTESEYGVSWYDDRDGNDEIYFARISSTGGRIGSDIRITSDGFQSARPTLVWAGSEFGVIWHDDRDGTWGIYFARISEEGGKIGADLRITDASNNPGRPNYLSLAWTGSEYCLSWYDDRDGEEEIYINHISADGIVVAEDARITDAFGYSFKPSLAWTGSEYGVSWEDQRDASWEVYFNRIGWCD